MGRVVGLVVTYLVVAWLVGIFPFGESSDCTYDYGYDDGFDGAQPRCQGASYKEGYEEGQFDDQCYYLKCERPDFQAYKRMQCGRWDQFKCR